jgi:hypothetical protein
MRVKKATKSLFFLHWGRDWPGSVPEIGAADHICGYGGGRNRGTKLQTKGLHNL